MLRQTQSWPRRLIVRITQQTLSRSTDSKGLSESVLEYNGNLTCTSPNLKVDLGIEQVRVPAKLCRKSGRETRPPTKRV